jgi:hypothetical protein
VCEGAEAVAEKENRVTVAVRGNKLQSIHNVSRGIHPLRLPRSDG